MSVPANAPPAYSDNPTKKTYGATSPASAAEPLLASQRGALASGSGRDAWMNAADDEEGSAYDIKDERNVDECEVVIRMAFIRKVYSILLAQLVATTAISAWLHLSSSATSIMHKTPSLMFIPLIGSFLTLFGVSYRRHVYPSNLILLGAFTVCESFLIGMVTSYMESRIVLQALILTSGVFVGLTMFTFQSKVSPYSSCHLLARF
jgi:FtsH-binding integral membrane protein